MKYSMSSLTEKTEAVRDFASPSPFLALVPKDSFRTERGTEMFKCFLGGGSESSLFHEHSQFNEHK